MNDFFFVDLADWPEQINNRAAELQASNGDCLFAMAELLIEALTNLGRVDHRKVAEIAMIVRPMIAKTQFEGEKAIEHAVMVLSIALIAAHHAEIIEKSQEVKED
jgi:uncharacterized protein YtpQ (UPF0354 family)